MCDCLFPLRHHSEYVSFLSYGTVFSKGFFNLYISSTRIWRITCDSIPREDGKHTSQYNLSCDRILVARYRVYSRLEDLGMRKGTSPLASRPSASTVRAGLTNISSFKWVRKMSILDTALHKCQRSLSASQAPVPRIGQEVVVLLWYYTVRNSRLPSWDKCMLGAQSALARFHLVSLAWLCLACHARYLPATYTVLRSS